VDERVQILEGRLEAAGLRFGIVASRFNDFMVDRLVSGAVDALVKHGATPSEIEVVRVPGAYEIPLALKKLAASRRHDALIALGCVIRGATPHFDYVAGEACRGITQAGLGHDIPIGLTWICAGILSRRRFRAVTKSVCHFLRNIFSELVQEPVYSWNKLKIRPELPYLSGPKFMLLDTGIDSNVARPFYIEKEHWRVVESNIE
jgi:6,7-dimethyl-8-ribityllumazine synthase